MEENKNSEIIEAEIKEISLNKTNLANLSTESEEISLTGSIRIQKSLSSTHNQQPNISGFSSMRKSAIVSSPVRLASTVDARTPKYEDYKSEQARYETLLKIYNTMKEKENDILRKEQLLAKAIKNNQQLNATLAQNVIKVEELRSSPEYQAKQQTHSQYEIAQRLEEKKETINKLEKELQDLVKSNKQKLTNGDVSSNVAQMRLLESRSETIIKQLSMANKKLSQLQNKVAEEEVKFQEATAKSAMEKEYQQALQQITTSIENRKSEFQNIKSDFQNKKNDHKKLISVQQDRRTSQLKLIQDNKSQLYKLQEEFKNKDTNFNNQFESILAEINALNESIKQKETQRKQNVDKTVKEVTECESALTIKQKQLQQRNQSIYQVNSQIATAGVELENAEKVLLQEESVSNQLNQTLNSNLNAISEIKKWIASENAEKPPLPITPEEIKRLAHKKEVCEVLKSNLKKAEEQEKDIRDQKKFIKSELQKLKQKGSRTDGKEIQNEQLRNTIQKIEAQISEAKTRYAQLQSLQKNYVPQRLIAEYRNRCEEQKKNLQQIKINIKQNQQLKKEIQEMNKAKESLEWDKNDLISKYQVRKHAYQTRIGELQKQDKQNIKRLLIEKYKLAEYQKSYPEFQIPVPQPPKQKQAKKKGKKQEQQKKVKVQEPKVVEIKIEEKKAVSKIEETVSPVITKKSKKNKNGVQSEIFVQKIQQVKQTQKQMQRRVLQAADKDEQSQKQFKVQIQQALIQQPIILSQVTIDKQNKESQKKIESKKNIPKKSGKSNKTKQQKSSQGNLVTLEDSTQETQKQTQVKVDPEEVMNNTPLLILGGGAIILVLFLMFQFIM